MANEPKRQTRAQKEAAAKTGSSTRRRSGGRYSKPRQGPGAGAIAAICLATVAIVAGLIVGCIYILNHDKDDGLILENVSIAGVDVGGMTKEVARYAVEAATEKTSQKNMVIRVGENQVEISPSESGVRLDIPAAIEAAYAYGRTGTSSQQQEEQMNALRNGYSVPTDAYMTLNKDAIQAEINDLGTNYSSTLKQSSYEITGTLPSLLESSEETEGLTLVITLGTPEYALDLDDLYAQVLAAYGSNTFLVEADCPAITPDPIDLEAIWNQYYVAPVDAVMEEGTFTVHEASYGYGFDLDLAKAALNDAAYGETVEIPFQRIPPEVLSESLSGVLYRDVLGTYTASSASDPNRDVNLDLACKAINGIVLYPGDRFSYNEALGERTESNGYKPGASYSGNETVYTVGGGICQVSSSLYYCALVADLEIMERECHAFAPSYMPLGVDATVNWGTLDFRFRNNTDHPIRIEANAEDSYVTVVLRGTDDKDYYVEMDYVILDEYQWETVEKILEEDNEDGYEDGDVIYNGWMGYSVDTYKYKYDKETDELLYCELESHSEYSKRDKTICKINKPEEDTTSAEEPEASSAPEQDNSDTEE
mgnify:CR=1 FL=1